MSVPSRVTRSRFLGRRHDGQGKSAPSLQQARPAVHVAPIRRDQHAARARRTERDQHILAVIARPNAAVLHCVGAQQPPREDEVILRRAVKATEPSRSGADRRYRAGVLPRLCAGEQLQSGSHQRITQRVAGLCGRASPAADDDRTAGIPSTSSLRPGGQRGEKGDG